MNQLAQYVTTIPDFPEPGVLFRDITSVFGDADGLALAIDETARLLDGVDFDVIVGLESRGFLLGSPVAYKLHKPFVLIRKQGKLPRETVSQTYALEYGTAPIEIHRDDLKAGQRVFIIDNLIATGGTLAAAAKLVEQLGAEVAEIVCMLELKGLKGREKLPGYLVKTVLAYEGK